MGERKPRSPACGRRAARLETVSAEQLSMRKLAAEIGVSHQAPYTHFRSRTRFLAAVAGAGLAAVAAEARGAVEHAEPIRSSGCSRLPITT